MNSLSDDLWFRDHTSNKISSNGLPKRKEKFPGNKVGKAKKMYHYCFQENVSESNKVRIIVRIPPAR
jgi:hypothetical protein